MVTLKSNEIDHHRQRLFAISSISILNTLSEIGKELVAAFENT